MKSVLTFRFDVHGQGGNVDVLVVYIASANIDVGQLLDAIDDQVRAKLRPDELIIIMRAGSAQASSALLAADENRSTLLGRVGEHCHVQLFPFTPVGGLAEPIVIQEGTRRSNLDLPTIIRRGGTAIFKHRQGFVEGSETYHFRNPSDKHTDRFMRLSNILVRQAEISFMALSLLPLIPAEVEQAYIDTPSLYAVVAAINDLRDANSPPIPADNFGSYYGLHNHEFTNPDRSLAIVSASSSGGLASKLQEKGFPPERVLHLLYLGDNTEGLGIAINLAIDITANPEGEDPARRTHPEGACPLCDAGSQLIELQGDQFDISPPQPRAILVRQAHAPKSLTDTIRQIVGANALGVTADKLHVVDLEALLLHPPFTKKLEYLARRFVPGGEIFCILADPASRALADEVARTTGQSFKLVEAQVLGAIQGITQLPGSEGPILIVAGTIGSGRVLLDISRELRTAAPDAPLIYLAGFAKPQSAQARETLTRNLVFSNHYAQHALAVVDELILPAANRENAWQAEKEFLERRRNDWPEPERGFVDRRLAVLRTISDPLVDNLFVSNKTGDELKLRPGFAFWPADLSAEGRPRTQADIFFTISSILQSLRTAPPNKQEALRTGWFRQTTIHPEVFGRFNDGVIQAAFLRAALPSELDYRSDPVLSAEAARTIRRVVEGAALVRGEGAFEFLLALACGRLRLLEEHRREVIFAKATPRRIQRLLTILRSA